VLLAITFAVGDADAVTEAGGTSLAIFDLFLSPTAGELVILISCIGQLFCGMACVTSASRMTYAFSRDRAIPGWRIWTKLDSKRVPVGAVLFVCFWAMVITLPALKSNAAGIPVAFFAVVSVCVIGLYIAYAIPIYLRWRMRDEFKPGPWNNGAKYRWMNLAATIWVGIITVIFCLPFTPAAVPFSDEFDWNAVNYAPLTVGGLILAVGIWWLVSARHSFTGPVRTVEFAGEGLGVETDDPKEPTPA
jgi:amino acid transporter